jgi:hypothetical protein
VLPLRKDDQHFLSSSRRNGLPLQNIVFVAHLVFDEFLRVVLGAGGQRAALQLEKEGGRGGRTRRSPQRSSLISRASRTNWGLAAIPPGGRGFVDTL